MYIYTNHLNVATCQMVPPRLPCAKFRNLVDLCRTNSRATSSTMGPLENTAKIHTKGRHILSIINLCIEWWTNHGIGCGLFQAGSKSSHLCAQLQFEVKILIPSIFKSKPVGTRENTSMTNRFVTLWADGQMPRHGYTGAKGMGTPMPKAWSRLVSNM